MSFFGMDDDDALGVVNKYIKNNTAQINKVLIPSLPKSCYTVLDKYTGRLCQSDWQNDQTYQIDGSLYGIRTWHLKCTRYEHIAIRSPRPVGQSTLLLQVLEVGVILPHIPRLEFPNRVSLVPVLERGSDGSRMEAPMTLDNNRSRPMPGDPRAKDNIPGLSHRHRTELDMIAHWQPQPKLMQDGS